MNTRTAISLALALALSSAAAWAESPRMVAGERAEASKAQAPIAWRDSGASAAASRIELAPMAPERILELEKNNEQLAGKRLQVGIERATGEAAAQLGALRWKAIDGGSVARIEVRSPDAMALRLGLKLSGVDDRVEMRFAGSDQPSKIEGLSTGAEARRLVDGRGLHWSPATDGDTQVVELFAPDGVDFKALRVQVARQPLGLRQQFAVAELLIEEHQRRLVRVTLCAHHQVVPERGHRRTDAVRQALRPEAVVGADGIGDLRCVHGWGSSLDGMRRRLAEPSGKQQRRNPRSCHWRDGAKRVAGDRVCSSTRRGTGFARPQAWSPWGEDAQRRRGATYR